MIAPHTTRRGFLSVSALAVLGTCLRTSASTLTRSVSGKIRWINSGILPLPTSVSYSTARENVLSALEQNKNDFSGPEIRFRFISFLPNGSTVKDLLLQKQQQGEITLETQTFLGLGEYIRSVNGHIQNPQSSKYWRIEVNGAPSIGASQKLINIGDEVSLILGSALHDRGTLTEFFNYSDILLSENIPLWRGKFLTQDDWPTSERGSVSHDFFEIESLPHTYFVPATVSCIRYIERWNGGTDNWTRISKTNFSTLTDNFIGKSWNETIETNFDQPSTRMIYGSIGTGFPPMPGTSLETSRISARHEWLRTNKVRIRTVLNVVFAHIDGSYSTEEYEWASLETPTPFAENSQPLRISADKIWFQMPPGETGVVEIQTSPNLKDWQTRHFTESSAEFALPQGERFARTTRRY